MEHNAPIKNHVFEKYIVSWDNTLGILLSEKQAIEGFAGF